NLFFLLLYQDSVYSVGDAHSLSKANFAARAVNDNADRWTQFSVNLLGDPTLTVYRHPPRRLILVHAGAMVLGESSYDVTLVANGAPVRGARVAAVKTGEAFAVGNTDTTGPVTLAFTPKNTGDLKVCEPAGGET